MRTEVKWVEVRDGEVINVFQNRGEAIKYFVSALKETIKEFKPQIKSKIYDYSIEIPQIKIKPVFGREAGLGI